jgi:hypothetical protein
MHQNFLYDLITWNLLLQRKNMNHGKHVTPEKVSTSTNLNICNILLHGKKNYSRNWTTIFVFSIFFCYVIILLIDCVVKFPCVSNAVVDLTLRMYHRVYIYIYIWQQSLPEIYLVWIINNGSLYVDVLNVLSSWITLCF